MSPLATKTLLEITDDLHRSAMSVLALGLKRSDGSHDEKFKRCTVALADETLSLLKVLKSVKNKNNDDWAMGFRWCVFSLMASSGCFFMQSSSFTDRRLLSFAKTIRQCVETVVDIVNKKSCRFWTSDPVVSMLMSRFKKELDKSGVLDKKAKALVDEMTLLRQLSNKIPDMFQAPLVNPALLFSNN